MTKLELIKALESFSDDSEVVFTREDEDLYNLDDEGIDIKHAIEVKNKGKAVIALAE